LEFSGPARPVLSSSVYIPKQNPAKERKNGGEFPLDGEQAKILSKVWNITLRETSLIVFKGSPQLGVDFSRKPIVRMPIRRKTLVRLQGIFHSPRRE
jgi:hypothetical protein